MTFVLLCVAPIVSMAEEVEIDGIRYSLVKKIKEATVISKDDKYSGDIIIPSTVEYENILYNVVCIGNSAFKECYNISSIDIPSSVTSIEEDAFYYCTSLTSVTIPNSVISIGRSAFAYCSGLCEVFIGDNVETVGAYAFYVCSNLKTINIPSSVLSFGERAFGYCYALQTIDIPNGEIGPGAFYKCTNLTTATIGGDNLNKSTIIKHSVFEDCEKLSLLNIGINVTYIGSMAFNKCKNLKKINISDLAAWCNISFDSNPLSYAHNLYLNDEIVTELIIPNNIRNINARSFMDCTSLISVTIPNSVVSIGKGAFYGCTELTSLSMSDGVTNIENESFTSCSRLSSIDIPNSVKYIGDSSFEGCTSVISISIGNGIQQIGSQAFSNCSDLENFTCHSIVVPQTDISAFDNSYTEYAKLKVPDESLNAYKATAPWSGFGSFEGFSGNVSEKEKCATPTIHYANGKITFECETEGVTYQSTITNPDVASYYGNEINLGGTYNVKVYATKPGWDDSDEATATINLLEGAGIIGDVDGDGLINMMDVTKIINIILGK